MKILLDTQVFLWAIIDDPCLSSRVRSEIIDLDNEVYVSVASEWEIAIKFSLGKLSLPEQPDIYIPAKREAAGFELLKIDEPEVCLVHRLPPLHRDPIDRILIAQANCHGFVLATNDPILGQYPVQTLW